MRTPSDLPIRIGGYFTPTEPECNINLYPAKPARYHAGETVPYLPYLKQYRLEAALSQRDLAEKAGISRVRLVDLEREVNPAQARVSTMRKLAMALGLEPRILMNGS